MNDYEVDSPSLASSKPLRKPAPDSSQIEHPAAGELLQMWSASAGGYR
jgi:hypothetical protein